MSITKNIQMSEFNGVDYDILLPQTRLDFELGNEYIWAKGKYENIHPSTTQKKSSADIIASVSGSSTTYISYGDSFSVTDGGYVNLNVSGRIQFDSSTPEWQVSVLSGKYVKAPAMNNNSIIFVPQEATVSIVPDGSSRWYIKSNIGFSVIFYEEKQRIFKTEKYVNSLKLDAFPPSINDGYAYIPQGRVGDKNHFANGMYWGSGTYGESNPNKLLFNFEPVYLCVFAVSSNDELIQQPHFFGKGSKSFKINDSVVTYALGNTTTWFSSNEQNQLNQANVKYIYFVLG